MAAGDLERPQQRRSPKRESGGDSEEEGGPAARLPGCIKVIRDIWSVTPVNVSILCSASSDSKLGGEQHASLAAEAVCGHGHSTEASECAGHEQGATRRRDQTGAASNAVCDLETSFSARLGDRASFRKDEVVSAVGAIRSLESRLLPRFCNRWRHRS